MANKLHIRKNRNLSILSISIDDELASRFKEECNNNFIEPKSFEIKLNKIIITGSGTYKFGAKYSDVIRKLIIEFLRVRDKNYIENYLKKHEIHNKK